MKLTKEMVSKKLFLSCMAFSMTAMTIVDYIMGKQASFFNAWALFVHTARLLTGLQLTDATRIFILHQDKMGWLAIPAAWVFFILFHILTALLLSIIVGRMYLHMRKS